MASTATTLSKFLVMPGAITPELHPLWLDNYFGALCFTFGPTFHSSWPILNALHVVSLWMPAKSLMLLLSPCSAIGYHSLSGFSIDIFVLTDVPKFRIIYSTFVFIFQWHVLYLCIPIMIRFSATCDTLSCGHFDAVTDLAFLFMFALDSHHLPDPRAFSHSPTSIITDYFCLVHRY
ncbi:hypothetical protein C8J56DRAFT_1071753 [Mycena floridula]|nr:hypothetical protein C8J56DRAFT_1071753 [Mycena floridula]